MSDPEHDSYDIEGTAALAAAAGELAGRMHREIALLSYQLPDEIYGKPAFLETIKHMVKETEGQHVRARVLVQEPDEAGRGNQLVSLGQDFSSFVTFRQPAAEHRDWQNEWLIVDDRHLLERKAPGSIKATCHIEAPYNALKALRQFNKVWEQAETIQGFRRIHL